MYWRAGEARRSRHDTEAIDAGIAEGRRAAASLLRGADDDPQPFDQS